jgi:uncharacterized membrane protein
VTATETRRLPTVRPADAALIAAVLVAGSVSRHAVYTAFGVALLAVCVVVLAVAVWQGAARSAPSRPAILAALALAVLGQLIKPPYMNVVERTWALRAGVYVAIAVTVLGAALLFVRRREVAAAAVAGLGVAYGLVVAGAKPVIDVWPILQGAAEGVVHGQNPYNMVFAGVPAGQVNNCFNYLPGTFLVPLPGRLLFGDVRWAEAFVLLAGIAALVWLAVRSGRAGAVPLAVLAGTLPGSLYDVQQAWNESIVFGALAAAGVLVAVRKPWWAAVCFAVALCTKQHVVLLLPLWALWPSFGPRRVLGAIAGAGAVTLPFFLANPERFWHCVVAFFLDLPARTDSLSIWQLIPGPLRTAAVLALVAAAYVLIVRGLPRTPGALLLGSGLVLAAFALANKQSFLNQWLLAAQLVVAGIAVTAATHRPIRDVALPA